MYHTAATFSSTSCRIVVVGVVVMVVVVSGLVRERWVGWVLSSVIECGGGLSLVSYGIGTAYLKSWATVGVPLWCGDRVLCWTSELVCGVG